MASTTTPHSDGDDWSLAEYPAPKHLLEAVDPSQTVPPARIGRYVIKDSLGHGGRGMVYLAEHPVSKQRVALKVIIPQQATPQAIEDFLREIRVLARFNHPRIATIYDADTFESEEGRRPYFTMQLIEGAKPVTDYARDARCPLARRLDLVLQAASAVAAAHRLEVIHSDKAEGDETLPVAGAHRRGVIHSDIKPSNALVGLDGDLRVVDFGASVDAADPDAKLRELTPGYAAPEQRREFRAVKQSDVYSLAVLAYEVLTGSLPFAKDDPDSPERRPRPIRKLNRKISRKVERVLLHALADRPEKRYADAEEFRKDLAAAARGGLLEIDRPEPAKPHTPWQRTQAFCATNRGPVLAGTAVIVALLLGLAGTTWQSVNARRQAAAARAAQAAALRLAEKERATSLLIARLKESGRRSSLFVGQFLASLNPYQSQGRPLDVDYLFKSAERNLANLGDDRGVQALARGIVGRVALDWKRFDWATNQLRRSVEAWEELAREDPAAAEEAGARREHAEALNSLAWAELGDKRQKAGLDERAARAEKAAYQAFVIRRDLDGRAHDETLCFQFDWLRMQHHAGDKAATTNFLELLAAAAGQDGLSFLLSLRSATQEVATLIERGDYASARQRVREFLAPFVSRERPRLRARVPWSLAQVAEELPSLRLPMPVKFALGLPSELRSLQVCLAEVANDLVGELRPGDEQEAKRVREALERIKAQAKTK
jgi:hypothetical protein